MKWLVFFYTLLLFSVSSSRPITAGQRGTRPALADTAIPVKIELEQTRLNDMVVVFVRDTANSTGAIKDVFGKAYNELMNFTHLNRLRPLRFMAWYYSMKPPWPVDIAIQVDSVPVKLSGRVASRVEPGGQVIIAHMQGPYEQEGQAYLKINTWMKDNNRHAAGAPFEVYINDPASVRSPSEIRTDIYQRLSDQ